MRCEDDSIAEFGWIYELENIALDGRCFSASEWFIVEVE